MALNIITRAEWGARKPDPSPFSQTSWANRHGFVVHYSAASKTQTVRAIQNYQMDTNGWRDIGYNFLVDYMGNIFEGCQGTWLAIGAHVANHNTSNIGVCAIGKNTEITDAQMRSIRLLYDETTRRAGKSLLKRYHSGMDGAATECPGDRLRAWVQKGMQLPNLNEESESVSITQEDVTKIWNMNAGSSTTPVSAIRRLNKAAEDAAAAVTKVDALAARVDQLANAETARDTNTAQQLSALRTLVSEHSDGTLTAEAVVERMGELLSDNE